MEPVLNLAIGQCSGELLGPDARLIWLANTLEQLEGQSIDLLLLPELSLTGYNIGEKLLDWAEPFDGPYATAIAALARQHRVAIHYGFAERLGDNLFNSAQCFGPDGQSLHVHRKLVLPPGFEADHFSPGRGCELYELEGFKLATLICYDAEFPETCRYVASLGAQLVLVPTALGSQWDTVAHQVIPTRAFENGVYVAYANQAGSEGNMTYLGASCIVAPNGQDVARAGSDDELLIGCLQRSNVEAAQKRLPYLHDLKKIQLSTSDY